MEKKAPKGCILTKQEWTFELSENTDNKENSVIFENLSTGEKQKGSLVYENPLQKGKLLIQKEDDEGANIVGNIRREAKRYDMVYAVTTTMRDKCPSRCGVSRDSLYVDLLYSIL